MLGYAYGGKKEKARAGIDGKAQKRAKKLKLKEPKKLAASSLISHQRIDETNHDLENRSFTAYYIFLAA